MRKYDIVLFLLIIANILNVFADRTGEEGGRAIIQAVNGFAFLIVLFCNLTSKRKNPSYFNSLKYFLIILVLNAFFFILSPNEYANIGNYVRLALNVSLIIFFYNYIENRCSKWLMYLFIVTFILQSCAKIVLGSWFSMIGVEDSIGGGDTVSLGLVMCVPLIFIFMKKKYAFIAFLICVVFIMFSLRRSSILALIVLLPFLWSLFKDSINRKNILIILAIGAFVMIYSWRFVGDALVDRMSKLITGDDNYSAAEGSYGSGRTVFWGALLNHYWGSARFLLGYGLGSVHEFFSKYYVTPLSHAHSDLFELLYTFGIVGAVLYFIFYYNLIRFIRRCVSSPEKNLLLGAVITYLFVAISTGTIMRAEFYPMGITIPILIYMLKNNISIKDIQS